MEKQAHNEKKKREENELVARPISHTHELKLSLRMLRGNAQVLSSQELEMQRVKPTASGCCAITTST